MRKNRIKSSLFRLLLYVRDEFILSIFKWLCWETGWLWKFFCWKNYTVTLCLYNTCKLTKGLRYFPSESFRSLWWVIWPEQVFYLIFFDQSGQFPKIVVFFPYFWFNKINYFNSALITLSNYKDIIEKKSCLI